MSRGRHAQPAPPRSDTPLLLLGLLVAGFAVAAVWGVDDKWALQVAITGVVALALVGMWAVSRSSARIGEQLWRESVDWRRELAETRRDLSELKAQHLELLLELRLVRQEGARVAEQAAQAASDADQRALMREFLQPREPVLDPVYPSLQLPLVRAAFSTELPADPIPTPRAAPPGLRRESTTGGEAPAPRQLLDLTASEIARLRPAN